MSAIRNTNPFNKIEPGVVLEVTADSENEATSLVDIYLEANLKNEEIGWDPKISEEDGKYYIRLV